MINILIIIKDDNLREKLRKSFYSLPFHLIESNNREEDIQLISEQYPELIITDLDGLTNDEYERLLQIRKITIDSPIKILNIGKQSSLDKCLKLWELGITGYLPINFDINNWQNLA